MVLDDLDQVVGALIDASSEEVWVPVHTRGGEA